MTLPARVGRVLDTGPIAPVSLTTVGDIATWTFVGAVVIMNIGVLVTTAHAGALPIIRFDWRATYGTDVGRYNGLLARFQFPQVIPAGSIVGGEARFGIAAGNQVICAIEAPGGAGSIIPWFDYEARPENWQACPGM